METITLTNAHGEFVTDSYHLDQAMARYLPACVNDLSEVLAERAPDIDFSDMHYVSEYLVVLASFDFAAEQNRREADRIAADG